MRTRASALIGRESELTAALGRLRSNDEPSCFLVGDPGVGKSRLIAEVSTRAQAEGWLVARGRASSIGPVSPLRPFAEALAGVQRQGLIPDDHLGGYRPLLARVLPELACPASEAPPLVAFAEAVLRLLSTLGGRTAGFLLVLEDLHDADPDSLAVLDYLLDNTTQSPVVLLGALRDEPSGARELLVAAERRGAAELLPIHPLDRAETGPLVASCLGSDRPAQQVTELSWRNTAGNPLAVEELLYHLIQSGQLRRDGEDWLLSPEPVTALPPSMLQLIGARIECLDSVARRLVVSAAVYGEQFPLAIVQAALCLDESDFLDALGDATAAQLVVAERPDWHRFHHPLTHAAALELANPAERQQAAKALAEAILATAPEPAGARTAARLLDQAGQLAPAGELYAQTGRQALADGAVEWAVADLTEAMRLREPDRPPPAELIRDLAHALWQAGQLDRALELVDQLGPPPAVGLDLQRRAQIHLDLAWNCCEFGRFEQARLQLAKARSLVAGTDAELLRVHCKAISAWLASDTTTGVVDPAGERLARTAAQAAERLVNRACDASERQVAADVACRAWGALVRILQYLQSQDRYQDSIRVRRRIMTLAERHNLPVWAVYERVAAATERWMAQGDDLAMRALRDEAERLGHVDLALHLQTYLWAHEVMVGPGNLAPAVAGLTTCAQQARRLGVVGLHRYAVGALLLAAGLRADHHALAGTLAQYEAGISGSLREHADAAQAFCLALAGQDGEALAALAEMDQQSLNGPYHKSTPLGLLLLLGTLAGTTSPEQTSQVLATASRRRWARQFLHWAAAVHAGRQGDREEARRQAALAAQAAAIYPVARHLCARLVAPAAAADGWGNPIEDLRAAEAWFHEQGVAVAARTCRDLLRSLGAPVQQRRTGTATIPAPLRAAGVTVREYEVGLLVREHLGNRDIGQRLHISPRTVEKHVAALQTKLLVPDRRALIARLVDG